MATDKFFKAKQAAAVLKHGLLSRYVRVFASKAGSAAPDGRVVYVDGYAGPGLYDDGSEGSPAIAIGTAEVLGDIRDVAGFFVEKDAGSYATLKAYVEKHRPEWVVRRGDAEDYVDEIFEFAGDEAPMFVFLDPFGLALSFESTVRFLQRSKYTEWGKHRRPTEVLLNISLPGIRRNCGKLDDKGTDETYLKARATILANVDRTLGGDWWREIWRSGADDRVQKIAAEYVRRLAKASGYGQGWYRVPVADRWGGPASYYLCLFTQHSPAHWLFNENLSCSMEEYRTFCVEQADELDFGDASAEWIDHIAENVRSMLSDDRTVVPGQNMVEVYGDTLGFARATHVRKAVKRLYDEGVTTCNGKGDVDKLRISPAKRKR